jgi:hypothetical protein
MRTIKLASIVLAALAAGTGVFAAHCWYRASKIQIEPPWDATEPGETIDSQMGWTAGLMQAFKASGDLNKTAARWTAVSFGLGAVSTLVGILA